MVLFLWFMGGFQSIDSKCYPVCSTSMKSKSLQQLFSHKVLAFYRSWGSSGMDATLFSITQSKFAPLYHPTDFHARHPFVRHQHPKAQKSFHVTQEAIKLYHDLWVTAGAPHFTRDQKNLMN